MPPAPLVLLVLLALLRAEENVRMMMQAAGKAHRVSVAGIPALLVMAMVAAAAVAAAAAVIIVLILLQRFSQPSTHLGQ